MRSPRTEFSHQTTYCKDALGNLLGSIERGLVGCAQTPDLEIAGTEQVITLQ